MMTLADIRALPPIMWGVTFLTIILMAAIVQFIFRFQLPSVPAEEAIPSVKTTKPLSLNKLADLHLFGQNIPNQDLENLPETTLKLELKGIYSAPQSEIGSAIIAAPDGDDSVYLVGDVLPGGATLLNVYEDRVVLRSKGQLEVLTLPRKELKNEKELKNK